MDLIQNLSFGDKLFFLTLIFIFITLVVYYFYNNFFIYRNKKELSFLLYGNEDYIEDISLEDIFIMTTSFTRAYISYLIEIVIFKKNRTIFFKKGDDSVPYVYPNLYFNNMKLIFIKFRFWTVFNLFYYLICSSLFIFLIYLIKVDVE